MQQRDSGNPPAFNDYDWTGLTYNFYYRNLNDPVWYYDSSRYNEWGGNAFGPGESIYYGFADYYQLFGGKIQASGTSTYKWKWLPPGKVDDPATIDFVNFPVPGSRRLVPQGSIKTPPVFMLGRVQGSISADADWPGVTADGQLLDEWTDTTNANLQKFSGLIPPMLSASTIPKPTHGIAAATLDTSDVSRTTLMSLLSPTPFVEGYYVPNFNAIGPGDAFCNLQLGLETHAFAIELGDSKQPATYADNGGDTTLDLFKYAQKRGDGGNQFVYNSAGNLFIPAAVNLNGAPGDVTPGDTYYLAHYAAVQIVTDIVYTNPSPYTLKDLPASVVPRTPLPGNDGTNFDGFVYYGLPQTNFHSAGGLPIRGVGPISDLGNHTVQLQVNTDPLNLKRANYVFQPSETAHIQTFFKDNDFRHPLYDQLPADAQTQATWPNWFYYYFQVYLQLNPGVKNIFYDELGHNDLHTSFYVPNTDAIHITKTANQYNSIPVYGLRPNHPFLVWIGNLEIRGLDCFIATVAHEQGHRRNNIGDLNNPPIEVADTAGGAGGIDQDSDGLRDAWESGHHFDPNKPDTTDAHKDSAVDVGKGDREATCDIQALGALMAYYNRQLFLQDWSTGGTLFGKLRNWPAGQPQWIYTPRDDMGNPGISTNVLPSDALYAFP